MSSNSKLTIATHALAWMGLNERSGAEVSTSEQIANSVNTNPVVIRRLLGDLRKAGLVEARRGSGAGWRLTRGPEAITLAEVHLAIDDDPPFAMHAGTPSQRCPVGHGIQSALTPVYDAVAEAVRAQLAHTTVADVLRESIAAS